MHAHTVKVTLPISANYSEFSEVQYCGSARHRTSAADTCLRWETAASLPALGIKLSLGL